jgi:hypothetical protein
MQVQMKEGRIIKRVIWGGLLFLVSLVATWIAFVSIRENRVTSLPEGTEQIREISPDNSNAAFVWLPTLGGLGATVSQPYQVWIESQRSQKEKRLVFEADKTDWILLT